MSLFIKRYKYPSGRIYCSIVDGYRENNKIKQKVIQKYGYLDELEDKYDDVEAYLASELSRLKQDNQKIFTLKIDRSINNDFNDDTFMVGYSYLKAIFKELDVSNVLKSKQYKTNIEYSLTKAVELLTYSRILNPGSIKYIHEHKGDFFETFDLSLDDRYRCLRPLLDCKEEIFKTIWNLYWLI